MYKRFYVYKCVFLIFILLKTYKQKKLKNSQKLIYFLYIMFIILLLEEMDTKTFNSPQYDSIHSEFTQDIFHAANNCDKAQNALKAAQNALEAAQNDVDSAERIHYSLKHELEIHEAKQH